MKKIASLALFAFSLAAPALTALPATACMEAIEVRPPTPQKPNPPADVAAAERALDGGNAVAAARQVLKTFPDLKTTEPGQEPLKTRALRVLALANVRADGALNLAGFSGHAADERAKNLEWSVTKLSAMSKTRPNDPAMQADLGEAMSKVPGQKAEALKILGALADKDLMGSPQAYAALGRLRAEAGDTSGSVLAVKRCEEMARNPSVCHPAGGPSASAKPVGGTAAVAARS